MTEAASRHVVALVSHARHVPSTEREGFALRLHRDLGHPALILETCHRVEAYTTSADATELAAAPAALGLAPPPGGHVLTGELAVRHAISVAVGRDSVVVGEDQVLHQLRVAVDAARAAGALDPALERLFALALRAGRRARSWHQGAQGSLAEVALASIERLSGPVRGRDILVVGVGRMGHLAVRAAAAAGASVAVANRSSDGAQALARTTGARVEAFDPDARIGTYAGVIVAIGGQWPIAASTIEALARSTIVIVDLSVPAAVAAGVAEILGARLVTADDLARNDELVAPRDESAARFEALIDRTTREFLDWQARGDGRAAADALVQHADREREAELAALWRRLPDLEPEAREAIEGMTRHLASRLLRQPLERLGRDADGHDGRAVREIFAL